MQRVRKTVTIPKDLVEWAENEIKKGTYPGIRSFSGFIEYLLRKERARSGETVIEQTMKNNVTKKGWNYVER